MLHVVLQYLRVATAKKGRQVLVVFDRGVYGHPQSLNGYGVTCHFALSPEDADTQIIRLIKGLSKPKEWSLVSADRRIIDVANRSHVAAGCWFGKREQMERTQKQGGRFVVFSNDGAFFRESIEQAFNQLRKG